MKFEIKEYTVSELTKSIKNLIENNFFYLKVKGEVSGYKQSTAGHIYFSLKDNKSLISVVFFKQNNLYSKVKIEDGLEVIISGHISIYEERSNYQIIAESIEINGTGTLLKLIEERKQKLLKEGLFSSERKKPLPDIIKTVGIITSESGAALYDIISRLQNKIFPKLILYPSLVQGEEASKSIMRGITYFNKVLNKDTDIIVITRGGGSVEDLMCFNDEDLVRKVANSDVFTLSAVGHEIDYTLIDFASDLRVPTPTAVAEVIGKPKDILLKDLNNLFNAIKNTLKEKIKNNSKIIENYATVLNKNINDILNKKEEQLKHITFLFFQTYKNYLKINYKIKVEKLNNIVLNKSLNTYFYKINKRYYSFIKILKAYRPDVPLERGYVIIKNINNRVVKKIKDFRIDKNTIYSIKFIDGELKVRIEEISI